MRRWKLQDFRTLQVWQKAHELTLSVYRLTTTFPDAERYGLTSQIRRCAASVPANIAEGCGRGGRKDFARFLRMATGSASELEYHLLLAKDLRMIDLEEYGQLTANVAEVRRMLAGLLRKLRADS
ncbi:MAG: four helix bundle protein [Phycisphaerae bacterium]